MIEQWKIPELDANANIEEILERCKEIAFSSLVIHEVETERNRQKIKYNTKHDDVDGASQELAVAACVYAWPDDSLASEWPYKKAMNVYPRREELIVAAAMIVAEIERLDRKAKDDNVL